MTAQKQQGWWEAFYDDVFADFMLEHEKHDPEFNTTISFLMEKLDIRAGDTVFDQCCGIGATSLGLARKDIYVIGVDQCDAYTQRANSRKGNLPCEFHTGDAFVFKPSKQCDAAFNWYTSFGYSEDDKQNLEMLKRSYECLKPGGMFALDFTNAANVLTENKPCKVTRRETSYGEVTLVREYDMDLEKGMFKQCWTFIKLDGTSTVHNGGAKIYLPHRIKELLEECGFEDIKVYGGVDGRKLAVQEPRSIFVCRKPA